MNIHGKIWGKTQEIFHKNNVEIHRIEANKKSFCSEHKHEHKYNAFFIESGKLLVTVWKNDYSLIDETVIANGEMTIVKPGEFHKFEALENTVAYEIYWTELSSSDIVRKNCGGRT